MTPHNDRTPLKTFLIPENDLSLKLVFDNVRNYVIGASLLALSSWFKHGAPGVPSFASGPKFVDLRVPLVIASCLVGALLLILNLFQTYELFWRFLSPLMEKNVTAAKLAGLEPTWLSRNAKRSLVAVRVAAIFACLTLALVTTLFVLLYLVFFSSYATTRSV
jgi:hypothetical protein